MPVRCACGSVTDPRPAPVGGEPAPGQARTPTARTPAAAVLLRVLVVDDSPALLDLAAEMVDASPCAEVVGKAGSGLEALQRVAQLRLDVVLMDLSMPVMNGLEATRALRTDQDAPRVVLMSVHEQDEYQRAAEEAGAWAFLPKSEFCARLPILLRHLAAVKGSAP
jgi:CheY-like chemotaxis protein